MGSTMHKIQVAELGARLAKRGLTLTYEQASDDSPWRWTLKDKGGVMARLVELEHVERWLTDQEQSYNGSTARIVRTTGALKRAQALGWTLDKRDGMYQLRGADEEPIVHGLDIYSIEDALKRAERATS